MPIYEYGCTECGKHIEVFQRITEEPLTTCPDCGGEMSKLVSSTSFVLKGGGWYADGYSTKADPKASPAGNGGESKGQENSKPEGKAKKADSTPASSSTDKQK